MNFSIPSRWLSVALLLSSCAGSGSSGGFGAAGGNSGSPPGTSTPETPAAAAEGAPFTARLQRLTALQYRSTIQDIFGTFISVPDLEMDARIAGFDELGAALVSTSARGVELYAAAAQAVAKQVLNDTSQLQQVAGCTPASSTAADDACAAKFLDSVGRRLFRRPLDAVERTRYLAIASDAASAASSFAAGLETLLSALLQSPLFIYRAEWSEGTAGATVRINGYDMAARLSFALNDVGPSDELLDAAARGELDRDEGVTARAAGLLASERGQQNLENFFSMMLRLPNGTTPEAQAMKQETLLVLRDLNAQHAPFTEAYVAPFTFVNDSLAQLYGLPERPGTTLTKVMLPAGSLRRGLLGHAGVLSESGAEPSPILRGKYIREALLCQAIPPPPPSVVAVLPPQDASKPQTMRERLTKHRADPACAACHELMDPLGLALENFDGGGRYRADDRGMAIDPSGQLDGVAFSTAAGLGAALSAHPGASRCLVATLHRRLTGQLEVGSQDATLNRLRDAYLKNRQTTDELVLDIIRSETFVQTTLPTN